jgi:hypothetical protein
MGAQLSCGDLLGSVTALIGLQLDRDILHCAKAQEDYGEPWWCLLEHCASTPLQ